jgi:nucleoside-diphosphate-sugar epimerase
MTHIAITGALGHIGSRLIRELGGDKVSQVTLIDNLSTQRYASLFHLPLSAPFRFYEHDICSCNLDEILAGADIVVHLAAVTNAEGSVSIPDIVERTNLDGTRRVAEACARNGSRLIFLSTTSVYGPQSEVVDESCAPHELKPQSPYAASKLRAEQLLHELGSQTGLNYVIARFGTIFGTAPGMRFHTAINKFIWQAVNGQPLTVWRTAMDQRRPYLDITDATRALKFFMQRDIFDGKVYNVLTVNACVRDIITIIRDYIPETTVTYVDSPIMNQLSYTVSNQRFIQLGFEFRGSLRRSIFDTISLFQGLYRGVPEQYELDLAA